MTGMENPTPLKVLVVDTEGDLHVFDPQNRLSIVGLYDGEKFYCYEFEHSGKPYADSIAAVQRLIDACDLIVAFNSKHDLHWLRRYGIQFHHKRLWCLQYAEFCISGQSWPYPDLDTACKNRGLPGKSTYIDDTYWSKGVKTRDIPLDELVAYNEIDCKIEYGLFKAQCEALKDNPQLKRLIWYGSQDLLVTEEMEWNGIKYDHAKSLKIGDELLAESQSINAQLSALVGNDLVNWGSPADLSAVLYGGTIKYEVKEPYIFQYKDGRTAEKWRKVIREVAFPRLVEPLRGTKNAKGYSTDEGTLKKLRAYGQAKQIIALLLRKRELDKKVGTYYHGFPAHAKEYGWEDDLLHGQLNHTRAASGRLSSQKPNLQNLEYGVRECIITRFPITTVTVE